ncbi:hypothetical protein [Nonomuraea sp. NPDC049750]|uniref:hypothetical protein n=1 Tax=Nonomuraea sp. NPDC049750 TaxID=3154738 RepID=UPI0033EB4525
MFDSALLFFSAASRKRGKQQRFQGTPFTSRSEVSVRSASAMAVMGCPFKCRDKHARFVMEIHHPDTRAFDLIHKETPEKNWSNI